MIITNTLADYNSWLLFTIVVTKNETTDCQYLLSFRIFCSNFSNTKITNSFAIVVAI